MRRGALRRAGVCLHRWLGLTVGVFLVVAGLTGSALVFRDEIDVALNPGLRRVTPRPGGRAALQPALDAVARAYPGEPATRVRMPRDARGTYEVWLGTSPTRYVYVDPYTARVLGARRPDEFLAGWLFQLHAHALAGERGERAVGANGLLLAALTLSGLVVWWPGRRRAREALVVRRDAGPARATYDLHRATGFWASAALLVAALTGASLVFSEAAERVTYALTGGRRPTPPRVAVARAPGTPLGADRLLALAARCQPGGVVSYVYLPTATSGAFRVRHRLPGELHPNGRSAVTLDAATGRVVVAEDGRTAPRGGRLYAALYPIHTGMWGGAPARWLAVLVGLTPMVLASTGALMWWRRRRRGSRTRIDGRAATSPRERALPPAHVVSARSKP